MGVMLRKIDNRRRWDKVAHPWLGQDEIPADPLRDLNTKQNILSVFYIKDDLSNLNDVIVAIAATRDSTEYFDYLLFDEQVCSQLNIEIRCTKGATKDEEVNRKWHRNLVELSADMVLKLSKILYQKGETKRVLQKDIRNRIVKASQAGKISIQDHYCPINL